MAESTSVDPMPLAGIKVLELATWVMAPAAAGMMANFGADVIKIEPPGGGDPSRGSTAVVDDAVVEPGFELANGGKRSIQVDVSSAVGQRAIHAILTDCDVFVTNVRASGLERAGLNPDVLVERYPRLVVAHATGYGPVGAHANRPAFDELAYWSRAGIASILRRGADEAPVGLVGAMGDLPSASALLSGILMALLRRQQTGRGGVVDVSLLQCGLWANGWALQPALSGVPRRPRGDRLHPMSPLYTMYQCRDGEWVQLAMPQPDRYWAGFCAAIGRPELATDERFSDRAALVANAPLAAAIIQETFSRLGLDEVTRILDLADLPWSPIFDVAQVLADEQARVNGYITSKTHRSGVEMQTLGPPFSLRGTNPMLRPAPEAGQDTELLLSELGLDWDEIASVRAGT
ncbi:MAG: CoA transferase [Dehalococcoidia bacterium]|nr:MAG: CoA transferase [Dehalococcoidia bacterium]